VVCCPVQFEKLFIKRTAMPQKRYKAEKIVAKVRQIDVLR
jgi:hypothetical protein